MWAIHATTAGTNNYGKFHEGVDHSLHCRHAWPSCRSVEVGALDAPGSLAAMRDTQGTVQQLPHPPRTQPLVRG